MAEKLYFHAPLLDFKTFTLQNPHFLLELEQPEMDGPYDTRNVLAAEGFVIKRVRAEGTAILFDVDRSAAASFPGTKQ
jgi:hypothetical protein